MRDSVQMRQGLMDLAQFLVDNGCHTLIEVGCFAGESTQIFRDAGLTIFAVDPWIPNYLPTNICSPHVAEAERQFDARFANDSRVIKCKLSPENPIQLIQVDAVYIDGNHEHSHVLSDIKEYLPFAQRFIGGHDYPEVYNAVNQTLGKPDYFFADTSWLFERPASLD